LMKDLESRKSGNKILMEKTGEIESNPQE